MKWLEAGLRAGGGDGEQLAQARVFSSLSYSLQCLPYDQVSRANAGLTQRVVLVFVFFTHILCVTKSLI